jgi:hypothetical protein
MPPEKIVRTAELEVKERSNGTYLCQFADGQYPLFWSRVVHPHNDFIAVAWNARRFLERQEGRKLELASHVDPEPIMQHGRMQLRFRERQ